ncbi:MAG: hypothetical protein Q4D17_08525, partial [Planctomycetia bacterium]|nr:hypothetical protein [Planctomycetia bacterium]
MIWFERMQRAVKILISWLDFVPSEEIFYGLPKSARIFRRPNGRSRLATVCGRLKPKGFAHKTLWKNKYFPSVFDQYLLTFRFPGPACKLFSIFGRNNPDALGIQKFFIDPRYAAS